MSCSRCNSNWCTKCGESQFSMNNSVHHYHQWRCGLCGAYQKRWNCGMYECLTDFTSMEELIAHMKEKHPSPGIKAYFVSLLESLK